MEKIVLIGEMFVSGILLETIKKTGVPVFGVDSRAIEEINKAGITPLSEKEASEMLAAGAVVYSNSEDVLLFMRKHSQNNNLLNAIDFFKDKFKTRELSNKISSPIFFQEVRKEGLKGFKPPSNMKLVIKPSCGFHSLGVKIVANGEWEKGVSEVIAQLGDFQHSFKDGVVGREKFIVEEYLEGSEYACDAYFASDGLPVVLGIYKHEFADDLDVRDCVYYTSSVVLDQLLARVEKLLGKIAQEIKVSNMPIHFEFKDCGECLQIIEVNPLRFGGFGLADLAYYAYGINPYAAFLSEQTPDWSKIIEKLGTQKYAFVVGQAPKDRKLINEMKANYSEFKKTFSEILSFTPIDFTKYSFFAVALTKNQDLNELKKYLYFDFEEYFSNAHPHNTF